MDPHTQAHSSSIQLDNLPIARDQFRTTTPPSTPHVYYSTIPLLSGKFHDLDSDLTYARCEEAVLSHATNNFIVDFGGAVAEGGGAWCAVDIDHSAQAVKAVKELLKKPVFIRAIV
ncbi:hypothetical protein Q9L58_009503 [Maublancomyces gigas]|uniref:Uncharacterized protein n=1 Tax=Discina gigas TaxID=1032678 RepID=A0ABR3G6R3_9PEZI